jgi:hypothetical protein
VANRLGGGDELFFLEQRSEDVSIRDDVCIDGIESVVQEDGEAAL